MIGEHMTPSVDRDAFVDVLRTRRSTRSFDPAPLTLDEIEALIDVARWAPSPSNRQPWKFLTIANQPIKDAMRAADIDPAARGETLAPSAWLRLARRAS